MQFGSDPSSYRLGILPISSTRDLQIYSKGADGYGVSGITFYTGTGPNERMRIDSAGNVGIGTASPSANLEVKGSSGQNIYVSYTAGSQLRLKSDSSNSGVGTTGSTPLLFLMNNGEVGQFDTSSNFKFNSGYGSVATAYGCRAWATFNGTTSPATLNASGGITSMTKNSTGNYTVNFSFTFPDANYAAYFGIAGGGGGGNASFVGTVVTTTQYGAPTNKTTTVCQIQTNDYTSAARDFTQAYVAFIR
jgi:hypothetical protein